LLFNTVQRNIPVCSKNHARHTSIFCVQKAEFMFISDFIWGLISPVLPDLDTRTYI